jgi:signal transduction histidine kinase/ActR/RegA family two-component response regulator
MNHEQVLGTVGATVGAIVALLTLGLSRAPGCRALRWLALIAATAGTIGLLRAIADGFVDDRMVVWVSQLNLALSGVLVWGWVRYEAREAERAFGRLERVSGRVSLGISALSLVPSLLISVHVVRHSDGWSPVAYADVVPTALGAFAFVALLGFVCALIARYVRRWRHGQRMAGVHALGLGGFLLAGASDALDATWLHSGMHLMPLGLLWAMGWVGLGLVGQFVVGARSLAELSSRLEQDVVKRNEELATARATLLQTEGLVTLGRLSAAVAHEINNPVAVVAANLAYLRDARTSTRPTASTDEYEAIQDTLASVDRISGIVRQLGEAGELAGHGGTIFPVDLAGTIGAAVAGARARAEAPPPVTVEASGRFYVSSQEASLRQVIASLVAAAMEALRSTDSAGGVRVSTRRQGDLIQVRIEDDAPEQDDILRERRFKPYFDTRPEIVRNDVGLSVSLALVRMLGADLVLERSDENGSVVCIGLRNVPPPAVLSGSPPSSRTQRARVLIVDDDVLTRIGMRRLLGREYVLEEAGSVEQALAIVRQNQDDLDAIVCDLVMPDGGAEALMASLQQTAPRLANAVLLLTGGAVDAATGAFLAAQAHRVVRKPVDVGTLRAMIEKVRVRRGTMSGSLGRIRG